MNQPLLSAASILAALDLKEQTVAVPEWPNPDGTPGHVRLMEMGSDRSILFTNMLDAAPPEDGMFLIVTFSVVDDAGELVFKPEDIPALRKKNIKVLDRLQRICLDLNGMSAAKKEEAKNA